MNNYELSKLKRSVIAKAWLAEKLRICKGEGTRDWSVIQQDDILNYNSATGFVGHFLSEDTDENNMKVQFVEMSVEFLCSHDRRKNNRKTGRINTDTFTVTPSTMLPVIKLSEPSYLGYFESHRGLFIGQDTGFGLKVTVAKPDQQADSNSHKNKFGLESKEDPTDSTVSDASQQRIKKYGF